MSKVLSIPPYLGGNMANLPYSTNVLEYVPHTLKVRAAKWPLMGAEVELPYLDMTIAGERLNGAAIVKDDCSIPDDGGEVVFHPMTYKQLRKRLVSLASDTGHDEANFVRGCGTHIHLSPAWHISGHSVRAAFNEIPDGILDALAGRRQTTYCLRGGPLDSHYSAISTSCKFGTIEVRHAQGMTSAFRLGAWLDTVYGIARRLRKGDAPDDAAAHVLRHATPDMARAIAEGPPRLDEVETEEEEDNRPVCYSCDRIRNADAFACSFCDYCQACCNCALCNACDSGGPELSLCDTCESCDACCSCARCENCGDVDDSVGDCDHDEHANFCGECCKRHSCDACDAPTDYGNALRDYSTNFRTLCLPCSIPVVTAYNVGRDARLAVVLAEEGAFIGPRRVKMSLLSPAKIRARGLENQDCFEVTASGWNYRWVGFIYNETGVDFQH